jgi:hypothetical protein
MRGVSWVIRETGDCQPHATHIEEPGLKPIVQWEETEPFQGGESTLWSLTSLISRHAWGIVIAANPNSDDTCPAKPSQRLSGECPILVVWRRSIEEVACLDKDVRSALDSIGNRSIEAGPQAASSLCSPGRVEARKIRREVVVAGGDNPH